MSRTALTGVCITFYSPAMEDELAKLEKRLDDLLAMVAALRAENRDLRARNAGLEADRKGLAERMEAARGRLQNVADHLPA